MLEPLVWVGHFKRYLRLHFIYCVRRINLGCVSAPYELSTFGRFRRLSQVMLSR